MDRIFKLHCLWYKKKSIFNSFFRRIYQVINCELISSVGTGIGTGTASVVAMDTSIQPAYQQQEPPEQQQQTIKVSSAAIRIVRPKSNEIPLAKRRLLRRRDSSNENRSNQAQASAQTQAQVIVTQFIEWMQNSAQK